jgi:MFS family permease
MGGIITNYLSWRWIMFVNVPIGLLLAFAAPRVLIRGDGKPGRLDLPGAITVTAGVSLLVYSLARVATHDWSDNVTRETLAIAVALLVTFVALGFVIALVTVGHHQLPASAAPTVDIDAAA